MTTARQSVLFDISHPAHVHLFKNTIHELGESGVDVVVTARQKDVTTDLLASEGIDFLAISRASPGRLGMAFELSKRHFGVLAAMRRSGARVAVGTSVSISHIAALLGGRALIFNEDDADCVPLFAMLAYPLAHTIYTPEGLRVGKWGHKTVTYPGYHELAYLHPDVFTPDPCIHEGLGLGPNERFSLVRLSALRAHHDSAAAGLSPTAARTIVGRLTRHGRVFVSGEADLSPDLRVYEMPVAPARMHHVLAAAELLVTDSQTMSIEAAVLGVPSVRCSTFTGRLTVPEELEHSYGLAFGFSPFDNSSMLAKIDDLLQMPDSPSYWREQRCKLLDDKINVATWITAQIKDHLRQVGRLT